LGGFKSVGGDGGAVAFVVKEKGVENGLVPSSFFALTRQKYFVSGASPLAELNPEIALVSLTIKLEKSDATETWRVYETAWGEVTWRVSFQVNLGLIDIPVATLAGDMRMGAKGAFATVVNEAADHGPGIFCVFNPLTRQ